MPSAKMMVISSFSTLEASSLFRSGGSINVVGTGRVVSLTIMDTLSPGWTISLRRSLPIGFWSAFWMIDSGSEVIGVSFGMIVSTGCVSGMVNDTVVFPKGSSSSMVVNLSMLD